MSTTERRPGAEREWWLRAALVLQSPRQVFAALRRDTDESARQEPLTAVVLLAGIAGLLALPAAGRLLNEPEFDGLLVAIWAFLGGGLNGIALYWLVGALLYGATRLLGGDASYRRARHVVGLALAPAALSLLLLWPVRLALFGDDLFRRGGSDSGAAGALLAWISVAFFVWTLVLLAIGVHTAYRWSWPRSLAALGIASAPVALVAGMSNLAVLAKIASSSSGIA